MGHVEYEISDTNVLCPNYDSDFDEEENMNMPSTGHITCSVENQKSDICIPILTGLV